MLKAHVGPGSAITQAVETIDLDRLRTLLDAGALKEEWEDAEAPEDPRGRTWAHHAVIAHPLNPTPVWIKDMLVNQFSHFHMMMWYKDNRMREYEAWSCDDGTCCDREQASKTDSQPASQHPPAVPSTA